MRKVTVAAACSVLLGMSAFLSPPAASGGCCEARSVDPFGSMSMDWGPDDMEGFVELDVPSGYAACGGRFPMEAQAFIYSICRRDGIDYAVARALMEQASGYRYDSVGSGSEQGYFQVSPMCHGDRMKELNVDDLLDPYQNAMVALDYLKELLDRYEGDYAMALTAYSCGPDGAYRNYFSVGKDANGYSRSVLAKAERIRKELEDAAED